jgi:hypothetical protein
MEDGFFRVARHSMDFHHPCNGHRACANASRRRLAILDLCSHALITHRTSQKAELFCEIRMMRWAADVIARRAMDAYYCWLFP